MTSRPLDCGVRTRRAVLRFVCCFLGLALSVGLLAQTTTDSVRQVVNLLRAQQFQQALSVTGDLLQTAPHDCRLLSLRGLALNGLRQPLIAKQAFQTALRYCPKDLLPLEGAAQIAYAHRQPDAISLLKRVLVIRPESIKTHAMLAALYRSKGDCSASLPHYEASALLFSEHLKLERGYAFCLGKTGHYAQAANHYQQVLAREPDAMTRYNLALMQWRSGSTKSALATLQPLLRDNDNESVLVLGARLAEEQGDTPQAVKLLHAAILLQPKSAGNYLEFAQIAFNHHSFKVGIDMVNAGLTQLPNNARLYVARGVLEVQVSQIDQAIADFRRAHQLQPQLSLVMDAMGIMQSQQQKPAAALNLFRNQVRLHPNDGLLQYLYAEALSESASESNTMREAITAARRSVAINPQYEPARNLLALLYLHADHPKFALSTAQAALRMNPDDETALYQEIMAQRRLGHTSEVQRLVTRLKELREQNAQKKKTSRRYVLEEQAVQ